MHNEKLFYLLGVKKLEPNHIYITHRAIVSDSKHVHYAILSVHPL